MPDNWWNQYGKTYPEVNQNLGGLPEVVRKIQATPPTPEQDYSLRKAAISSAPGIAKLLGASPEEIQQAQEWRKGYDTSRLAEQQEFLKNNRAYGNIVSGTEGAMQGLTMGGLEALQKGISPESVQQTEMLKKEYPTANTVGNVAGGLAGAVAIPGAGEALAARGGALAAKGLIPLAARAALNTATTAIPSAAMQAISTGDPGQAWNDLKSNMLFGTVGGAVIGKLISGAPKVAAAARDVANDLTLHAAGVPSRAIKGVAAGGRFGKAGATAEKITNLKDAVADLIGKNKLYGKEAIEEFTKGGGKLWDAVDDAFKASGAKPSQFLDEVVNHPVVQKLLNDPQYGAEAGDYIQNMLQRGDSLANLADKTGKSALPDIREILTKDIKNGIRSTDVPTQLKGEVADAIHDVIDGHFVPQDLKDAWPALKLLKLAAAHSESMVKGVTEAGSATAPRAILQHLMGGGEGALLGGATAMPGFDPNDPSSWGNLGARMAMGTVGGALANKLMAGAANQIGGRTAGLLRGIVPKISEETAAKLGTAGPKIGSKVSEALGTGQLTKGPAPEQEEAPVEPSVAMNAGEQEGGIPQEDIAAMGGLTSDQQSVVNMQPNAAPPAPEHAKEVASATRKEQELTSDQKTAAGAMLDPVREKIKAKLLATWQSWQNPYKDDWDKFYKDAQTFSDNFNPLNQFTAKIIGGKDYKDYLRSYNVALRLQTLGTDLSQAIAPSRAPAILARLSPGIAKGQQARDELVNTLWTAMSGDLKPPSKADRLAIETKLEDLRNQRLTPKSAKKKIMDMLQQDYNVRFDLLDQYGMI